MTILEKEIELCVQHIHDTNSRYTVMGDFIAKCLLVRICGKYEVAITKMVRLKLDTIADEEFCNKMNRRLKRFSLLSSELEKKILKLLGDEYIKKFNAGIDDDTKKKYNNLIENRHSVAHGRDIMLTIDDISEAYQNGKTVLCAFESALGVGRMHNIYI